jgi:hypothetical protein
MSTAPRPRLKRQHRNPLYKGKGRGSNPNSRANLKMWQPGQQGGYVGQRSVFVAARQLPLITQLAAKGVRQMDIARA